jgi:hypothetical protein
MESSPLSDGESYLGLLSFLSFTFSVIAAVLAIDMYTLLRTGEFGKTWRVIIIASVMFVLLQVLRMAEALNWHFATHGLSQIVELMFALALAYAFYLQRKAFTKAIALRGPEERRSEARAEEREAQQRATRTATTPATAKAVGTSAPEDDAESALSLHDEDEVEIEWEPRKPLV